MSVKHLTTAEFDSAVQSAALAMVDFWAPWCGPCRMLGPVVESLGEAYEGRVLIAKVNVDEEMELARRFDVANIPLVVFLKNGQEAERLVGLRPQEDLAAVLDRLLK